VGYFPARRDESFTINGFSIFDVRRNIDHVSLYEYLYLNYPATLTWTLGLSIDLLTGSTVDRQQVNPKLGVTWTPLAGTTVRAAVFRSVKRELVSSQTLEPTQVAGFNQLFDDVNASEAWRYGVGIDQKIGRDLIAGVEWSRRILDVPFTNLNTGLVEQVDWTEQFARAYLYWSPTPWVVMSAEYQYEQFDRDPEFSGVEEIISLRTHRWPLGLQLFGPLGLRAGMWATIVDQKGEFDPLTAEVLSGHDTFVVVDALIGWRLPKRRGLVTLEARNLFDSRFNFQDTDPANPRIAPERIVVGRVTLVF
jgi:outer membrane receptor protein involved in Fe transport